MDNTILVKSLMTNPVVCAPADTLLLAHRRNHKKRGRSLRASSSRAITCRSERSPNAKSSSGTLPRAVESRETARQITAADAMTSPAITVSEACPLFEALVIARSNQIRHLPVTKLDGTLAGGDNTDRHGGRPFTDHRSPTRRPRTRCSGTHPAAVAIKREASGTLPRRSPA